MVKIVGIGGGTGLAVLLRGLNQLSQNHSRAGTDDISISAIVSVADSGGSSGMLRQALGIPAVGDLRNCIVALSGGNALLADLFQFRFPVGDGLKGHSLGNVTLAALWQQSGSLGQAVERAAALLHSRGRILPVTEVQVTLCAEFQDGSVACGEAEIPKVGRRIERVWLVPENPLASAGVLLAIARADAIVLGPGSLYTSIVPNLLVANVARAIRESRGLKVFVCNLMTEQGETDNLSAADHLRELERYLGRNVVDVCVLNSRAIPPGLVRGYSERGSRAVEWNRDEIARKGVLPLVADLLAQEELVIRHDPIKLGKLVLLLACQPPERKAQRAHGEGCKPEDRIA